MMNKIYNFCSFLAYYHPNIQLVSASAPLQPGQQPTQQSGP